MSIYVLSADACQLASNIKRYRFSSGCGTVDWPMEDGAFLGAVGAWNVLLRMGWPAKLVTCADLPCKPGYGDVLIVSADGEFKPNVMDRIRGWLEQGGFVIASGCPEVWQPVLPTGIKISSARHIGPSTALGWLWEGQSRQPWIMAPPKWTYAKFRISEPLTVLRITGNLVSIGGERQTPSRALVGLLEDAPAIVEYGNFCYLNGNPFAAFQAWLQGQEDLEPWLSWRNRIFWLDEYVADLKEVLSEHGGLAHNNAGVAINGLADATVVLRHDLDDSRDCTYLELEREAGLSGVHAILRDRNFKFWLDVLRNEPNHETAFHFDSASAPNKYIEYIRTRLLQLNPRSYQPAYGKIAQGGLLQQVKWAKRQGIGIQTLHRHLSYIIYPELVDALDVVFDDQPDVLGGSSFFRALVLRWGVDRIDGNRGSHGDFPDPQFPYWFPFKLAHAGRGGKMLEGWETSSIMEIEPDFFEQLLKHQIPGLPHRVFTLNYHPAHANRPTFTKGGSAGWFQEIVEMLKKDNVEVMTLRNLFDVLNKEIGAAHVGS